MFLKTHAKAVLAAAVALLTGLVTGLAGDESLSTSEYLVAVVAALTALGGVSAVTNKDA